MTEYLVFRLGEERYGFPLEAVREIRRPPQLTPLPNVPSWLRGVTNLRGQILAVVELGLGLGLGSEAVQTRGKKARLVVVRHRDVDAAFLVDRVEGVQHSEELGPVPDGLPERFRRSCPGVLRGELGLAAVLAPEFVLELRELLGVDG